MAREQVTTVPRRQARGGHVACAPAAGRVSDFSTEAQAPARQSPRARDGFRTFAAQRLFAHYGLPCNFDALPDDPRVDVDALPDDPRVDFDALLRRRDDVAVSDSTEAATPDTLAIRASTACNPPCAWTMGATPGRSWHTGQTPVSAVATASSYSPSPSGPVPRRLVANSVTFANVQAL